VVSSRTYWPDVRRKRNEQRNFSILCACLSRVPATIAGTSVPPGRPYLAKSTRRLYEVFAYSPHLPSYVGSLEIVIPWVAEDSALVTILGILDALTSFVFETRDWKDFHWCDLPQEFQMAICTLCQRSSLVKLHLCNLGRFTSIDEFASPLASPAFSDLSLMQLELPPQSEGENLPTRNRLSLTSCRLNLVRGHPTPTLDIIAPWLVHGGSLSHLRHLNVSWVPEHTPQLQRILNATMSSLQTLSLTLNQICTFPRSLHGFIVIIVIEFGYSHTVLLAEQSCAREPDDAPFHQADIDAQRR
jgi:hypothetical protein